MAQANGGEWESNAITSRRYRAHKSGNHALCSPERECRVVRPVAKDDAPIGSSRRLVDDYAAQSAPNCRSCNVLLNSAANLADLVDKGESRWHLELRQTMRQLGECRSPAHSTVVEHDPFDELYKRRNGVYPDESPDENRIPLPDLTTGRPFPLTGNRAVDDKARADAVANGWVAPTFEYRGDV